MTHHPASTMADVRETCRILRDIPHWGRFRPATFELMAGSPLYEGLSRDERAALRPARRFRLPSGAARYALEYAFELPEALNPGRDVMRAWSAFARQYTRELARHEAERPRLDVVRTGPDTLRITDTRHGHLRYDDVSGDAACIYDACHAPLTLDQIAQATGLSPETVSAHLARFLRLRLVVRVDGSYLSLALRSRDELLRRFFSWEGEP
jgi:DNA-binding transcriptional ArsR family regulator